MSASWMAGFMRKYELFFINILQIEGPVGLLPRLISSCPVDGKVHLHPDTPLLIIVSSSSSLLHVYIAFFSSYTPGYTLWQFIASGDQFIAL
jgi:hypothetical protein